MSETNPEITGLPKPDLSNIPKSTKSERRRSPRRSKSPRRNADGTSVSPYDSNSDHMRYKAQRTIKKEKLSKGKDSRKFTALVELSPKGKQVLNQFLKKNYPNAKMCTELSEDKRKQLFPAGPETTISFTGANGKLEYRSVRIFVKHKYVDWYGTLNMFTKSSNNFSYKDNPKFKKSPEQVARDSSVMINPDDLTVKEPIRADARNFGASAITVPQQYLYDDQSIWYKIEKNKDKLRYLVTCEENFTEELKSDDFAEIAKLLQHSEVLNELKSFLTVDLPETLKQRVTILLLLRAFELCHKQPHHTLTPELLEAEPFRDDTTSAPSYVNKQHIFYHETYIDELAADGYQIRSVCEPTMYTADGKLTRMAARLKHTLTITKGDKTLSFEFDYDCRTFAVPMRIKGLSRLLIDNYSQRIETSMEEDIRSDVTPTLSSDDMDDDSSDKENVVPSMATLLSNSSDIFTKPVKKDRSMSNGVVSDDAAENLSLPII